MFDGIDSAKRESSMIEMADGLRLEVPDFERF